MPFIFICYRYSDRLKTFVAAQKEMRAEESESKFFMVTQPLRASNRFSLQGTKAFESVAGGEALDRIQPPPIGHADILDRA